MLTRVSYADVERAAEHRESETVYGREQGKEEGMLVAAKALAEFVGVGVDAAQAFDRAAGPPVHRPAGLLVLKLEPEVVALVNYENSKTNSMLR